MGKRIITKIGDLFSVEIDSTYKKYFQYIANDLTQLNSDVIRGFVKKFPLNVEPDPAELVAGNVEFYAHCMIGLGVKLAYWKQVGHFKNIDLGSLNISFRDSNDYGEPEVKNSKNWYVWEVNKKSNK